MECAGTGPVYLAQDAMEVVVVPLEGETLTIESPSFLALNSGLRTDVKFAGLGGAALRSRAFHDTVAGKGLVAAALRRAGIWLRSPPGCRWSWTRRRTSRSRAN